MNTNMSVTQWFIIGLFLGAVLTLFANSQLGVCWSPRHNRSGNYTNSR